MCIFQILKFKIIYCLEYKRTFKPSDRALYIHTHIYIYIYIHIYMYIYIYIYTQFHRTTGLTFAVFQSCICGHISNSKTENEVFSFQCSTKRVSRENGEKWRIENECTSVLRKLMKGKGGYHEDVCFYKLLQVFYQFSTSFLRPPLNSPPAVVIRRERLEQLPRSWYVDTQRYHVRIPIHGFRYIMIILYVVKKIEIICTGSRTLIKKWRKPENETVRLCQSQNLVSIYPAWVRN